MKIREKLFLTQEELAIYGSINIVIFGDSVSQGCLVRHIDYDSVYWNRLRKKLNAIRDFVPVNMICSAISGITATESVPRLEKQVLNHDPDAIIICFGLNDVNGPLENYLNSLRIIFQRCAESGAEVIFMTPNMMNTYVADDTQKKYWEYAHKSAEMQNSGKMDLYISEAIKLANEMNITVCDCYSKWKELAKTQDVTMLLANRINHPIEEMHNLFAESLYEILIGPDNNP